MYRPFYLPKGFTVAFLTAAYIPLQVNVSSGEGMWNVCDIMDCAGGLKPCVKAEHPPEGLCF